MRTLNNILNKRLDLKFTWRSSESSVGFSMDLNSSSSSSSFMSSVTSQNDDELDSLLAFS